MPIPRILTVSFISLLCHVTVGAIGITPQLRSRRSTHAAVQGHRVAPYLGNPSCLVESWYEQPIDHFNFNRGGTWNQRCGTRAAVCLAVVGHPHGGEAGSPCMHGWWVSMHEGSMRGWLGSMRAWLVGLPTSIRRLPGVSSASRLRLPPSPVIGCSTPHH